METILEKLIAKQPITDGDIAIELYEVCDRVHASCNNECPVFKKNGGKAVGADKPFKVNRGCDCFKNGCDAAILAGKIMPSNLPPNIEYLIELRRGDKEVTYAGISNRRRSAPLKDPSDIFPDYHGSRGLKGFKKVASAVAVLPRYSYYAGAKVVAFDLNATPCVPVDVETNGAKP